MNVLREGFSSLSRYTRAAPLSPFEEMDSTGARGWMMAAPGTANLNLVFRDHYLASRSLESEATIWSKAVKI